jgi:hypothetical protein
MAAVFVSGWSEVGKVFGRRPPPAPLSLNAKVQLFSGKSAVWPGFPAKVQLISRESTLQSAQGLK